VENRKIVIAGAGITGSVQALLLAGAGFDVVLVEAKAPVSLSTSAGVRSVAVSCRSHDLMQSKGFWPPGAGCPIYSVLVSERGQFGSVCLKSDDLDVDALGYVVGNEVLEQFLLALVEAEPAIDFICPAKVKLISNSSAGVVVEVDSQTINAGMLIAADGTNSALREATATVVAEKNYNQHAIVANLGCQRDHQNVAYERFTESGPLALLPLADRQMAMVYTVDSDNVQELSGLTDADFLELVQKRFGGKLGRFQSVGPRKAFPLSLMQTERQHCGACVFIGNSARTLHPVAGQGLNLALRDVFALASVISDATDLPQALTEFSLQRQSDQRRVTMQTDALAGLFLKRKWPLQAPFVLFRVSSMLLLDSLPVLRNRFGAMNAGIGVPLRSAPANWRKPSFFGQKPE